MPDRRPRGYQPDWQPRPATLELLTAVELILGRYAAHLPLTIRQIWYAAVVGGVLAKQERTYKRLVELLGMARRSGRISWLAIRDDTEAAVEPVAYDGPDGFRRAQLDAARGFRLDRQAGQEARLEVWCDTAGLVPQLAAVTDPWGVPVYAGAGGLSGKRAAARRAAVGGHATVRILVINDWDPGGLHLFTALAEDITAFAALDAPDVTMEFDRLAVTERQVAELGLPTAPVKAGDRRSFPGTSTTQAEALPPDALATLVRDAISGSRDTAVLADVLEREEAERRVLLERFRP
ncbi:hypothetical protein QWM81_04350 [Streptomyces ficellus]|uniref:DUF2399 domain-containing protein n=1 Tax=Streptomyces ficellus TaxID=1977088 RepID=A0ABT7Z2F6_9ACTN|nr:hypothetical protein [Streptomyces ficellus]MDN3293291.1 hypothetical protein [Streptomyces ficellus]